MGPDELTIMLPFDRTPMPKARLEIVKALAHELRARVVGAMACEHSPVLYYEAGVLPFDAFEEDRKRLAGLMADRQEEFRSAFGQDASVEWRSAIDWPTEFVAREARIADLLLCFRPPEEVVPDIDVAALVLKAGRPVLLVEEAGLQMPPKVLIAWKDAREARRATLDALPMLRLGGQVHVLEVIEGEENPTAARSRVADVGAWLRSHGIGASESIVASDRSVADQIDAVAHDLGTNLVVAGAYGHSRLGEWIFGGVTRHLIANSDRSVLTSH